MNTLTPGDRVYHPNKREWGLGKVLSVTPDRIDVFFVGAGKKQLSTSYVKLEVAEGEAAVHPLLDNLISTSQQHGTKFLNMPAAIQRFLQGFPGGFEGKRYHEAERDYKVAAHRLCVQLLDQPELTRLISEQRYQEVCDRARKVEAATNLLASFEKIKFNDALKQPENHKFFAESLADLLYGPDIEETRFRRFCLALMQMEIGKWPIATYFGFIRFPDQRIFLKPAVTQSAAELCCWEISYSPELNWRTYNGVLSLFQFIQNELIKAGMPPKDMIDVQSFIWCSTQY